MRSCAGRGPPPLHFTSHMDAHGQPAASPDTPGEPELELSAGHPPCSLQEPAPHAQTSTRAHKRSWPHPAGRAQAGAQAQLAVAPAAGRARDDVVDAYLVGHCSQPFAKRLQQQQDGVLADWLVLVSTGDGSCLSPHGCRALVITKALSKQHQALSHRRLVITPAASLHAPPTPLRSSSVSPASTAAGASSWRSPAGGAWRCAPGSSRR